LLLERKLPLGLKTIVMTLNRHELDQMKSLAASLGAQFRFDPVLHAAIDGSIRPTNLRLSPDQVVEVERADPDRTKKWPEKFREDIKIKVSNHNLFLCSAGKTSFHVDAVGRLSMCLSSRQPSYNLRTGSFKDGWELFLPQVTSRQYTDRYQCAGCQLRFLCAQCPADAEIECQDAEACVEYLCKLTKIRYNEFITEK
jgi:radical SAM protein with 4Fe4S-binding SPASM domain